MYYGSGRVKSEAERYENNYKPTQEELEATPLKGKKQIIGLFPPESQLKVSDANKQNSPINLYESDTSGSPALNGKLELK